MLKRRLLLLSLVMVLVLTAIVPAPALARSVPRVPPSQQFYAVAEVAVVDPGFSFPIGNLVLTWGERIEGNFVAVENWPALEGASISVRHNSIIRLSPDGTFAGSAEAKVTVLPVGGGKLTGTYRAKLEGQYLVIEGQLLILEVLDSGTFKATGRILGEDGRTFVTADGEWNANLFFSWDYLTLTGPAYLDGKYRTINSR